jgi:FtsP/CotA-like multicopper oxidase with cupredoxin domain
MIVDFTNVPVGNYVLGNVGADAPFGGFPIDPLEAADPLTTGQIMQFNVVPMPVGVIDSTTPPAFLQLPPIAPLPLPVRTRPLALLEEMSMYWDGPAAAMLGTVSFDPMTGMGMAMHNMWMDPVTENPNVGDTEIWEFYNFTADAHPMHIHEVVFEVMDRQPISFVEDMGHIMDVQLAGPARPPEPWESGFKDTVTAYPGEVTRVRAQFLTPGQFVWHCHIVEHEDNEMMRPYRIGPVQPGQPG